MNLKPALIFDLDGTLVDSRESILSSIRFALKKLGRSEVVDEARAVRQDLLTTLRETGEKYGTRFRDEERFCFLQFYRRHQKETAGAAIKTYSGVKEVIRQLREHFVMGVATTKTSDQAVHILEEFGLAEHLDHIQGTDRGLSYKPAPDILLKSLEVLGVRSDCGFYMGDSPNDLRAAHNAGMRSIAAAYGFSERSELEAHAPHLIVEDFSELLTLRESGQLSAPMSRVLES